MIAGADGPARAVALALLGIYKDVQQRLPRRFALAHAGASLIGVGSALFHAVSPFAVPRRTSLADV